MSMKQTTTPCPESVIQLMIELYGSQNKFAKALGVPRSAITMWRTRGIPKQRCWQIAAMTNDKITRFMMRPDLFQDDGTGAGE